MILVASTGKDSMIDYHDDDPEFYEDDWFVLDKRLGEQVPVREIVDISQ